MRKSKYYNNLPFDVFKKLGVEKLDTIIIKLISIRMDPDNPSQPVIPVYKNIPNKDTVIIDGNSYDIAAISGVTGDDKVSFYEIAFWKDEGGFKRLNPRTARDRDIIEFLLLSNYNASNPYRDPNVNPCYEIFKPEEKAKERVDKRMRKIDAISIAAHMSEEDLREFAASVGWDESADVYIIKDKILDWCEKDPEGFINAQSSRDRYIQATLRRAESRNIIEKNALESSWMWCSSGEILCQLPRSGEKNMYELFIDWYKSEERAVRVFHELEGVIYGRSHVTKLKKETTSTEEETESVAAQSGPRRRRNQAE
jgi:hypothetical protein